MSGVTHVRLMSTFGCIEQCRISKYESKFESELSYTNVLQRDQPLALFTFYPISTSLQWKSTISRANTFMLFGKSMINKNSLVSTILYNCWYDMHRRNHF